MRRLFILPLLLAAVTSACSAPSENSSAVNGNGSQPAVAQNGTAPVSPEAAPASGTPVQTMPATQPSPSPDASAAAPNQKPAAGQMSPQVAVDGPKLVVPVKRLNFGKQPKDKTLSRTFVIKNAGNAELKISAVEPS